jgi:hypothetical protein
METKHYFVTNLQQFVEDTKAVEKLKNYLDYMEVVFPTIEEVFGQAWEDNQIKIELNNSKGGASYRYKNNTHIVKMGICNRNIQKNYPENLWGCLFHETLHAFMNAIVKNDSKNRDLNNSKDGEPFTRSFQQTVYSKLKNKEIIDEKLCEDFFNLHKKGINNGAKELFEYYVKIFSENNNFSKFISYLKSNKVLFTNKDNFAADINKVKEVLSIS